MVEKLKLDPQGCFGSNTGCRYGEVLMLGYMNPESLELTRTKGDVWFYSRSRQELWNKGASGNKLLVQEMWIDAITTPFW